MADQDVCVAGVGEDVAVVAVVVVVAVGEDHEVARLCCHLGLYPFHFAAAEEGAPLSWPEPQTD